MLKISIVIPVYNAASILKFSIEQIDAFFDRQNYDYEILLRDDGSSDHSRAILERLAEEHPKVRYSYNRTNAGLGFTLRELFLEACGDVIVYSDCDLPFGVEGIQEVVTRVKEHDLVVASRYRGAAHSVCFSRKLASRAYYLLCKALFNVPVIDIGSGLVAIKKEVLERVVLKSMGFEIHVELFIKAVRAGFNIYEIPMISEEAALNTFSIIRHGPKTVLETIRLKIQLNN
ncbi:MAG TPA: glycosyltransferase family 2 protein [Candidatus Omnitrophota bacterium]|nr:glycosyltransferase family 2 protein [Candidatus Omnitrophota bacterium]